MTNKKCGPGCLLKSAIVGLIVSVIATIILSALLPAIIVLTNGIFLLAALGIWSAILIGNEIFSCCAKKTRCILIFALLLFFYVIFLSFFLVATVLVINLVMVWFGLFLIAALISSIFFA